MWAMFIYDGQQWGTIMDRRNKLKIGLEQLSNSQLTKILNYDPDEMVLDEYAYIDGKYWPIAIGLGVPSQIDDPTNENVRKFIADSGYDLNLLKGYKGEFYRQNRLNDLYDVINEILNDRQDK